jgi:hypothetical protein
MPLMRLQLQPGIDKQNTEYGAEGGWIDCDYVRFRYGLPEKLGGWTLFGEGDNRALIGYASEVFTWKNLRGIAHTMVGTDKKLYVYSGGRWADVTPIRKISEAGDTTFSASAGSPVIEVSEFNHGAIAGDFVTYTDAASLGGNITADVLNAEFQIQRVINDNTYTILAPIDADSLDTGNGGPDTVATYQINVGSAVSYFDYGWGVSTWGLSTWGTPRPQEDGRFLDSRVWQFDNYGEDVICQLVDGRVYLWDTSDGIIDSNKATVIANAPTTSKFALVSTPDRHLVCLGTERNIGQPSSFDPMFVRFSSQENINLWQESATNTAGGQALTDGNRVVSAIRSRGQILIFTDTALHGMQYIGPPFTFGFQQLGANCGCLGPHAAADVNGLAFWMGPEAFYVFDGTVKKLACTVQDYVFKDINTIQSEKVHVGVNSQFNEVTWWYCSFTSDFIDRFVTFNYLENTWHIGTMSRTSWEDVGTYLKPVASEYVLETDRSPVYPPNISGLGTGFTLLYFQEEGVNGDGQPINAHLQSGYFDIGDGDSMLFMKRFIPDFKQQLGNLTVRLLLRPYPQATASPSSLDPYVITPTTQKVDTRARGRQISLRIESTDIDTNWRFGTLRVDIQPDGLR